MGSHLCGIYLEQMRGLDRHEMGSTSLRACLLLQLDLGLHSWLWSAWDDTPLNRSRNRKHLVTANQFTERMLTN